MNKKIIVALSVVFLACSSLVMAQDDEGRDILELTISGGLALPSGGLSDWQTADLLGGTQARGAKTGYSTRFEIGYFATSKLTIGFSFSYTQFAIDVADDVDHSHRLFNPNIYAKYNFEGESNLVPYVTGYVGLENPKFSSFVFNADAPAGEQYRYREISYDPALALGVGVGLFYFTADWSGVFVETGYHYAATKNAEATYQNATMTFNETVGVIGIRAGVRLLIGSDE